MTALLVVLTSVVAVAAAIRSTWSPCGLSMLSTITPIGERGRNHRYYSTATWFVLGAVLGGATLGLGTALLAAGRRRARPLGHRRRSALAAVLAAVSIASDLKLGGFRLPVAHPPGERDLARPVPQLGLRRRLRLADRRRPGHLRHHLGGVPHDRAWRRSRARPPWPSRSSPGSASSGAWPCSSAATSPRPSACMALHRRLDELLPDRAAGIVLVQVGVLAVAAGAAWGPRASVVLGRRGVAARRSCASPGRPPAPPERVLARTSRGRRRSDEVVLGHLEVPHVGAVAAAVGDDVVDLPAQLGRLEAACDGTCRRSRRR